METYHVRLCLKSAMLGEQVARLGEVVREAEISYRDLRRLASGRASSADVYVDKAAKTARIRLS
jgi:hypothetical protein